jgi:hypothetical protein
MKARLSEGTRVLPHRNRQQAKRVPNTGAPPTFEVYRSPENRMVAPTPKGRGTPGWSVSRVALNVIPRPGRTPRSIGPSRTSRVRAIPLLVSSDRQGMVACSGERPTRRVRRAKARRSGACVKERWRVGVVFLDERFGPAYPNKAGHPPRGRGLYRPLPQSKRAATGPVFATDLRKALRTGRVQLRLRHRIAS